MNFAYFLLAEATNGLVDQAPAITGYITLFALFISFVKWMEKRHDAEKAECAAERRAFAEYREQEIERCQKYAVKGAADYAKRVEKHRSNPSIGDKP